MDNIFVNHPLPWAFVSGESIGESEYYCEVVDAKQNKVFVRHSHGGDGDQIWIDWDELKQLVELVNKAGLI